MRFFSGADVTVVVEDLGKAGGHTPLDELASLVAADMAAVDALIVARMDSPVALIPQLAGYIVAAGGKRLRPLLTLASARLCGYGGDGHHLLATVVEFIHTATLLHDDVVDESDLRRGLAAANTVWGNKSSVLVGDFLFSRSFQLMVETGSLEVLRILSTAAMVISEGEVLQLQTSNDMTTGVEDYLAVVLGKTAELFAAAAEVGAVIADRPASERAAMRAYGLSLGVAFQLIDDVLDYSASRAILGKSIGDDFREGKVTLPVILAHARGDEEERAFWRRTLEDLDQRDGDLEHAQTLLEKHGALTDARAAATDHVRAARAALAPFAECDLKRVMGEVADFVVARDH